jgi:hypothetical protein
LLKYGALVALALLAIWLALLILLTRSRLKVIPFGITSLFLAVMISLFWIGPEITELAILKVGSFKTNAEQASSYFAEIKKVHVQVEAEERVVNATITALNEEISAAQIEVKRIRAKVKTEEETTDAATASFKKAIADAQARVTTAGPQAHTSAIMSPFEERNLTDAQVDKIANELLGFKGQEFAVVPYWELRESLSIAKRIVKALTMAKWKLTPPPAPTFLAEGISGVLVYVNPRATDKTKKAANVLVIALKDEGIIASLRKDNSSSPGDKISLSVGTKP